MVLGFAVVFIRLIAGDFEMDQLTLDCIKQTVSWRPVILDRRP